MLPWQRTIIDRETAELARAIARWTREAAERARATTAAQVRAALGQR